MRSSGPHVKTSATRAAKSAASRYCARLSPPHAVTMDAMCCRGLSIAAKYDANNTQLNGDFVEKLRTRLMRAVDDLGEPGWDPSYGEGRLDAAKAVSPSTLDAAP